MKKSGFMLLIVLLTICSLVALIGCGSEKEYTISFECNGGTAISSITYKSGTDLSIMPSSTKEGYSFGGWFTDEGLTLVFNESSITSDITLYAKWSINSYTITFVTDGTPVDSITGEYGSVVTLPETTKEGCTFDGWYDGESKSSLTKIP